MNVRYSLALAGTFLLATFPTLAQERARTGAWQTAATNAPAKPAAAKDGFRSFKGRVVETMDAAGYTYVQVQAGSEKLWAATPRTPVKVGDEVSVNEGMLMADYHSRTLNRTFPVIYFAAGLGGESGLQPELPAGHPPIGGGGTAASPLPAGHPPLGGAAKPAAAPAPVPLQAVAKAPGGYTIQEIYAQRAKLAGKEVAVRGKVVKYNAQIMGRNWLHIQDGSGKEGANDLTVTTATPAKLGDTVLVRGVLTTDKDFGAGYKFGVILDNAQITVE